MLARWNDQGGCEYAMKKRFVLVLAIPLLIGVPWEGLCGEKNSVPPGGDDPAVSGEAGGSCRTIAAILRVYPALEVRKSGGSVRYVRNGSESRGCRILASGPTSAVAGEVAPDEAVRQLLQQDGWKEDPGHAADGPGTTSFVLRKGGISCLVRGGAPSGIENGKVFSAGKYELDAQCMAEKE